MIDPIAAEDDDVARRMLGRIRRRWGPLLTFSAAFTLLEAAALAPAAAAVLRLALESWGRCSVGNFEIAAFFLSPQGIAGLALLAAIQLTTLHLRLAGVMSVLAGEGPGVWHAFDAARRLPTILKLDLIQAARYLLRAAPYLAVGAFAYARLWGPHDLNRLVVERPAEFWRGAAVVGALAVAYGIDAGRMYLRWLFAVPAVLFEGVRNPFRALRASEVRTRGRLARLAVLVVAPSLIFLGAWFALTWTLGAINGYILDLDYIGHRPRAAVAATAVLLAFDAMALSAFGAATAAGFAALLLAAYKKAGGTIREDAVSEPRARWWTTAAVVISGGSVALAALAARGLISDARVAERVEVTAHRAGALEGPENTLAALRIAAAHGADWAEIDVQLTADGHLVVAHDDDLLRVAGSPLKIASSTLEQLREVDLGAPFDPKFRGERIATLEEFLDLAGKLPIRLNVELKAKDDAGAVILAGRTVAAIRKAGATARTRVCAQSFKGLVEVRRLAPELEIGFVSGAVIGDPTRLDVDFLMMETRMATASFIDRARSRGKAVHAWTVNNVDRVGPLVDDGVVDLITDDVPGVRHRLDEIARLDPVDRLLLRIRHGLSRR